MDGIASCASPSRLKVDPRKPGKQKLAARQVPAPADLPATDGNAHGLRRLSDVHADGALPPTIRDAFLDELAQLLGQLEEPPQDLHKSLYQLAHSETGSKYLRKGPVVPSPDYVASVGGLKRVLSLKWLCSNATRDLLARAHALDDSIDVNTRPNEMWQVVAPKLVELIKTGQLAFDPIRDVKADAMIGNWPPGGSGWFFAGNDANTSTPASLQTQLAVGPEYLDGYEVIELPVALALGNAEGQGASRPTALDLTVSPAGKLNPDPNEPMGRTDPQQPGQAPVREVVIRPIPLSLTARGPLVLP